MTFPTDEKGPELFPAPEALIAGDREEIKSPLPEHLIELPGGSWALWRWAGLRGAGFPAALVLKLSNATCAAAADELLQTEAQVRRARDEALQAVNNELDTLRRNQEWDNYNKRRPLVKVMWLLKKKKLPKALDNRYAAAEAVETLRVAHSQVDSAWENFRRTFGLARRQVSEAIRLVAQTDRFQEAVIWQNRHAFNTSITPLFSKPAGPLRKKDRRNEELVARYWQRYCVKNDTIGFFGPIGWARFTLNSGVITVRPGPSLLAERNVYFEQWCIDALAETLAKDRSLRPWFAPCRIPSLHIEGTTLYRPLKRPMQVFPELAAVFRACKSNRTAKEIATDLLQTPGNGLQDEEEVYDLLELMSARELISWTLLVPLVTHPERVLRQLLERIQDVQLRLPALRALDELDTTRSIVASAAGDAKELNQALGNLEATFTRLTGTLPTRSAGEIYGGRTLVYEDCRRDVEVHIGAQILESLGPPLSLLLTSARWLTFETAMVYRRILNEMYAELARESGSSSVDLSSLWQRARSILRADFDSLPSPIANVLSEFQSRWADVLRVSTEQRCVQYTSQQLRPLVSNTFDAPGPGWSTARYHSPDMMLAAASAQAIQQGRYQFVLGEVHVGMNTLRNPCFLAQHPAPQELRRALDLDLPEPRVVPVAPRMWQRITSRTYDALVSDKDFRLILTADAWDIPESRALPIGSLVVEDDSGELVVRTRDKRLSIEIIEFLADVLALLAGHHFRIVCPGRHTPRVVVDQLVVCRETWRFPPAEIRFPYCREKADEFLQARRWAHAHHLPRFVFVKAPVEEKPFFVDFDSSMLVSIFAKTIRQSVQENAETASITVTEMLPKLDQTWLVDAEGQHYTSELRIVAVDLAV